MKKEQRFISLIGVTIGVFSLLPIGWAGEHGGTSVKEHGGQEHGGKAVSPAVVESQSQRGEPAPVTYPNRGKVRTFTAGGFGFGVEYVTRNLGEVYAQTNVQWAKIANIGWSMVEPAPPVQGRHKYFWRAADPLIREWQAAGISRLHIVLKCNARWAIKKRPSPNPNVSTPPKDDLWEAYADYVTRIVERYDGDGVDDMPGLLYPVRYYEIESEAQHNFFWAGTSEEYLRLLEVAHHAAKAALADVQIILSGMTFGDLMDDYPSPETLAQRLQSKKMNTDRQFRFNQEILKRPDLFDLVEFHFLTDYKAIYGIVDWLRQQMRNNGYEKPIWAGDAFSGPLIYPDVGFNPLFPNEKERAELLAAMKGTTHPRHEEVERWFRREQSSLMTKKFVTAMEVGLAGVMMGNTGDWFQFLGKTPFAESTVFMGLIDMTRQGNQLRPDRPRPAYYTFRRLMDKLPNLQSIQRLKTDAGIYAYKITTSGSPVYVMWYDDNIAQMPGVETAHIQVELDVDASMITVTHIITEYGQQKPLVEQLSVKGDTLEFSLQETPILIEGIEVLSISSKSPSGLLPT